MFAFGDHSSGPTTYEKSSTIAEVVSLDVMVLLLKYNMHLDCVVARFPRYFNVLRMNLGIIALAVCKYDSGLFLFYGL